MTYLIKETKVKKEIVDQLCIFYRHSPTFRRVDTNKESTVLL